MIESVKRLLPANRLVALSVILTGLAAFITGTIDVYPEGWQSVAASIAGLITQLVVALKFLGGQQNWDTAQAHVITAAANRDTVALRSNSSSS